MSKKIGNTTVYSGVSFSGLLGIAFIILKLCKVITWSWLWVLSPLWIPLATVLTVIILVILAAVAIKSLKN